jgi:diguanylate cyclase (GGDEF)-like protein
MVHRASPVTPRRLDANGAWPPLSSESSDEGVRQTLALRAHQANQAAWASFQTSDYATTLQHALTALDAAREAGEREAEAQALSHLGHVQAGLGDYTMALELQQRSIAILRDLNELAGLPRPMAGLANLYGALGDHAAQRLLFGEALDIARNIGDEQGIGSALVGLGVADLGVGDPQGAVKWLWQGIEACRSSGLTIVETVGYDHLARAHELLGESAEAERLHKMALALAQSSGNRKAEGRQRQRLGSLLTRLGRWPEALVQLEQASTLAVQLSLPRLSEEIHATQSEAFDRLGDSRLALHHLRAQVELERGRLTEEARQRVGVLAAQTHAAWAQREAEYQRGQARAMAHLAHHDPLTGLANRAGVAAHLALMVAGSPELGADQATGFGIAGYEATEYGATGYGATGYEATGYEATGYQTTEALPQPFALLFLDLDGFKAVNDTLGHAAGDMLLCLVAQKINQALPPGDLLGRIGGDEFTVCAHSAPDRASAQALAQLLAAALDEPFSVAEQEVFLTVSVGISLYPQDGLDPGTLLRHADLAMYQAKRSGKNAWRHYSPDMQDSARARLLVGNQLRAALGREEFRLHYQPQVDPHTGVIVGMEALLRWFPDGGSVVRPDVFIPAAEESGLIVPIGLWVLNAACAQVALWRRSGRPAARVAVNVSPQQFARTDFVATVHDACQRHQLDPSALELELTERGVVQDPEFTARQFTALRALGVRIALDDFGAGESNLSRLLRLPFDVLKLDRELVRTLGESQEALRVMQAMTALARTLNLEVVAEGIETLAQLRAVRHLGCNRVQGYLLGAPLPDWPNEQVNFGAK